MNTRRQFRALLRIQFKSMLHTIFRRSTKGKKNGTGMLVLLGLLFLYIFGVMAMTFGSLFFGIGKIATAESIWIYFGLASLISFAFMFVGSVFATQNQLFNAKDNELLLSMPLPPRMILLARMVFLYLYNLIFELMVMLPAGVVYPLVQKVNPLGAVAYVLTVLLLPLLSLAVSCLIGWGIATVTARMTHKSLFTTLFSVLAMGAYFYFIFSFSENADAIIDAGIGSFSGLSGIVPLQWFGRAMTAGSFLDLLLALLLMIVPFALVYWLLSRSFIRIVTTKVSAKKATYRGGGIKQSSVRGTLLRKELHRLGSSPVYMMNSCIGMLFAVMLGVAACIKGGDLISQLTGTVTGLNLNWNPQTIIAPVCIALLCYINCLNCVSASSISLEGKTFWILRSSPLKSGDVLFAKVALHAVVCLPLTVLTAVLLGIGLHLSVPETVFVILVSGAYVMFCAILGVVVNLKFPKFDWTNEMMVVKQGVSILICMLGTMVFLIIPTLFFILLFVLTKNAILGMGFLLVFFVAFDALLWLLLRKWGVKAFEKLEP